jgi:hypothetical protein
MGGEAVIEKVFFVGWMLAALVLLACALESRTILAFAKYVLGMCVCVFLAGVVAARLLQ